MLRYKIMAIFCVLFLGVTEIARGVVVDWLYDAEIPVETQTLSDRAEAASSALREILTRVTGLRNLPMTKPVVEALRNPERYYSQYKFALLDDKTTYFQVSFESESVRGLVNRSALPIWGANRPKIIVWLVVEEGGSREVLGSGSEHSLVTGLRRRSRQRGLEISLPLMDLDEQLTISPSVVWGSFADSLYQASQRYGADLLLIGRATRSVSGNWITFWEFWLEKGEREFSFESQTAARGAERAVDEVGDELMQRFAVLGRASESIDLLVRGASSVDGYVALMRHLVAFEFINRVDVVEVTPDSVSLRVVTRSSVSQLGDLLSVDGVLVRESDEPLSFIWSGDS